MTKRKVLCQELLDEIRAQAAPAYKHGKVADYIPELSRMSPEYFSLSCQCIHGEAVETGDTSRRFTMQSISKVLSLSFALERLGARVVFKYMGTEPSADSFNSLMRLEIASPKPSNPFMNAGAIAICALLYKEYGDSAFDELASYAGGIIGAVPTYDERVCESEKATADRNRSLAYFMKSVGTLRGDVSCFLDLYFKQCSITCTTLELAKIGALFASGGRLASNGERYIKEKTAHTVLGLMTTCGLYNGSGEFAVRVGVPGKSGVGGGILAAVPGRMGAAVFSPPLDSKGNSVAGMNALEALSDELDFRNTRDE
ncbi:MAG: glutaminase A [Synergistaceae bacterium]|nr:glutaminase A [Synergistaceae bacterium]